MSTSLLKQGQVQNMETISVTIIIIILIVLGLVYFADLQFLSVESQIEEQQRQRAISIAQSAANMDEVSCVQFAAPSPNCMDYHSIKSMNASMSDESFEDYYFPLFGFSTIEVEIYKDDPENHTLYNVSREQNSSAFRRTLPILIENDIETRSGGIGRYVGELRVTVYE